MLSFVHLRYFANSSILCIAFGCFTGFSYADSPEKPLEVIVQSVVARNLQNEIEALANVRANDSTQITSKVAKTITAIHFQDGQHVNKGDVLVEMANTEEAALKQEAQLTAEEAKKQLDRAQQLSKTGAVSPSLLDQYTREYTTAKAHFLALESRYKDLFILAPFSGTIGVHNVSVGNFINPGQVIATLNDDEKVKIDFTVPAIYWRHLRKDLKIQAYAQDLSNKLFNGVIASIDNQIDEATRSIKIRALFDNPQHELTQGMLMKVVIHADVRKALAISEAALVPMGSNNFVFILKKNTNGKNSEWTALKQQIQIGKRERGIVEVISGLSEGDKVVTHGLQKIHDGQALTIMAEQSNDPDKPTETLSELLKQKKQ